LGIQALEECVDSLITIPNQRLLQIAGESLSLVDTFKKQMKFYLHAVQGISDLINNTGLLMLTLQMLVLLWPIKV
jgi:cell division protein FtsZ